MSKSIEHKGKIEKIENGIIYVHILQQSACADCHAKGICSAADLKVKTIEIPDHTNQYHVGEDVEIYGKASLGYKAVGIAFVLPLILLVLVIIIGSNLNWSDSLSSMLALTILVIYYFILYAMRSKLKKEFVFSLKKLN